MKYEEYKKDNGLREGQLKKKLGFKKGVKVEPGDMIKKANVVKMEANKRTAFMGAV